MLVTAIVLSMGTKFVNKEEILSGTRSEGLVTIKLREERMAMLAIFRPHFHMLAALLP